MNDRVGQQMGNYQLLRALGRGAEALAREVNPRQLPSIPPLHIHLLGDFLLFSGETAVANIDMPRLQSLLAYLLLHRTAPQSRSHLAFLLWPDSTEAQALTNLRNLVHKLRQMLSNADTFLHVDRQSLQWKPGAPWTLDVQDFEEALAEAEQAERSGQPATVRETLTSAVDLYRGDLVPSCYDEWILPDVWLTEIARIVPEVLAERPDLPHPGPMTEGWQRQHFFEALARAILRTGTGRSPSSQPLLLLLDDLQWSDRETLEWLHYLLRFDTHTPLLLVGTVRSEEMTAEHPLATLLKSVRRDGIFTEIALEPLDACDTATLAESLAGQHLDLTRVNDLYRETEGNPLFIVETVRAGALAPHESGANSNAETPPRRHSMLPPTVQAVIAARFEQLSPLAREIVNLAAVIGRAFTFDVLQQASDASEDTLVNGLDELWQRRIVREQAGGTYDFSHDKLREHAYASLSTARRRLLHRRVGDALVALHVDDAMALNSISGQIAAHYEQAGAFEQAIVYSVQAAEGARRTYANTEALAAYRRALRLLEEVSTGESKGKWRQEIAVQCYESIGEILALTGDVEAARDAYERALVKVPIEDRIRRAGLQRKIAKAQEQQHRYEEALQAYSAAEAALGFEPSASAFEWWQEWIEIQDGKLDTLASLSRMSEAVEVVEKLRPVVAQYGTPMQRAEFFFTSSLSASMLNRFDVSPEMLAEARAGLAAYEALGNMVKIGWSHLSVGSLYQHRNSLTEAEKHLREALRLGERTGDVLLQMRSVSFLALVSRKRGQVEEVRHAVLRALSMAETMHQPAYIALNKANLAWVAWRRGSLEEASEHSRAALREWQVLPAVYYSQWTALLPLIDIALTRDRIAEAVDNARTVLAPDQQRLPDALSKNLNAAIQAWEINQLDRTRTYLQQAMVSARETGYL